MTKVGDDVDITFDHEIPDVRQVLNDFKDVILPGDELPPGLPVERPDLPQAIPLEPGTVPIAKPQYRLSQLERREVERQIKLGLAQGRFEPSSSPWSAPVIFVAKKSGELRKCPNMRAFNRKTIHNAASITDIQTLLDQIGQNKVFSTLDCMSAYHQIRLHDEDKPKTAFRTHMGHYQYTVFEFSVLSMPHLCG